MAANMRTVTVEFRGTANALRSTTRGITSEFARLGGGVSNFGRSLSGFVSGGVTRVMRVGLTGLKMMAGLLFILPAAFLSLINPATIAYAAMLNFSRAVNATSPEEFVAATRNMAPAMKEAVMATRLLHPELKNLYGVIQQGFWLGFATDINDLARVYFPLLETGMGAIATTIGKFRHALVEMLLDPQVAQGFAQLLDAWNQLGGPTLQFLLAMMPLMIQSFTLFANVLTNYVIPALTTVLGWMAKGVEIADDFIGALSGAGGGSSGSGSGGGSGGGIGGFFGNLLSGAASFFSGIFGRAGGGSVLPGHSYIVGERGPEVLAMGGNTGYIAPGNGGNGDVSVHVYIGETELRDMIASEVERSNSDAALAARTGPGILV